MLLAFNYLITTNDSKALLVSSFVWPLLSSFALLKAPSSNISFWVNLSGYFLQNFMVIIAVETKCDYLVLEEAVFL